MLNNSGPRAKRSKLERTINAEIVSQIVILAVLCLIGAIGLSARGREGREERAGRMEGRRGGEGESEGESTRTVITKGASLSINR